MLGGRQCAGCDADLALVEALDVLYAQPRRVREDCQSVIQKMLKNVIVHPTELKFRMVKCTNTIIRGKVLDCPGGVEFLKAVGFSHEDDALILPIGAPLEHIQASLELLAQEPIAPGLEMKAFSSTDAHIALTSVLFLDIDGVLNDATSDEANHGGQDPQLLRRLATIVKTTNCSIVLSSSWRHDADWRARFANALHKLGVSRRTLIGGTPEDPNYPTRAHEIKAWLDDHPSVIKWAVVDDMNLACMCDGIVQGHFVQTDAQKGLRGVDTMALIKILQRDLEEATVRE